MIINTVVMFCGLIVCCLFVFAMYGVYTLRGLYKYFTKIMSKGNKMNNLLRDDKGKVKHCPSNWAKMTWYQYGWYYGWRHIALLVSYNFKFGVKSICMGLWALIGTIIVLPFILVVRPFLWYRQVRKARKNISKF